ncbi:TPA: chromate transporter [Legionella pneumophila subsp. pneumophila]|uniref:Chromate transporter n=1 Tax=Legionella pneumophila (strain Lens) TaxID=297245 RepID=Q5WZN7_LEGPL|nr:chromate transporter [Legionella pneumophila]AOW52977.1 chromate transporter [Legionella pneumophila subsp. pneumophila]AOW56121.1 chromate transporter [Legionella pneumophila subsp. pneumophila]AOW63777.1 chromate transporter [Legionella pneumophila subsp. pneumophila]RYW85578.1 chromate transporter [Legionella pneumophila]RYW85644.1 chromate transporter [Legionella pneumophila]
MIKTFIEIIYSFGKIGLISLGGGNSMLKLLEYEAVTYRHWIGKEEFVSMLGSSFLFPGLTGIKLTALIGYKAAGITGLILAIICLNLPGLIMALVGYQWLNSHNGPITRKIMISVQYGALALLAAATFSVVQGVMDVYYSIPMAVCCILFFLALAFWNLSPFYGFLAFIAVCFFLVR